MAKETNAKPKRTRRTKAEMEEAFDDIVQEVETAKSTHNKVAEFTRLQEQELLDSMKEVSSETVIHKFAHLNIEISKTLNSLSEKIVDEIQNLEKLRKAVEFEKNELQRLHKIDIAQTTLDALIEEYASQNKELEEEINNSRIEWENECHQRECEAQEYEENLQKSRKRENDEFEYKKTLERKKAQDKYEEENRLRDKENKEKQEVLAKEFKAREEALKDQEEEFATLRETVQNYPNRLQKEIEKAVSEAVQRTEQKSAQEIAFLKRDAENEKRIAELKIKGLEETLQRQLTQMTSMQAQLDEAKKQVQDIAVKAIEGASGARALSHINHIALEQAKGRPVQA